MRHAVIMAGGAGVRLWPLSRKQRPKQILKLFSGTSLLRQSYERVATILAPESINVITNQAHLPIVAEEIPEIPAANLFGEPVGRDTTNAIGLASAILAKRDPEAVIGVFTADHMISPMDRFCSAMEEAFLTAEEHSDALVTLGIRPNRPDTHYGYIKRGDHVSGRSYKVEQFTEKPSFAKAMKYVSSDQFYWNSGMFVWRAETILDQIKKHVPQTYDGVNQIVDAWDTEERQTKLQSIYPDLLKISIDFSVMERAEKVLVVEMDCHWTDVGSWPALESLIQADPDGNVAVCDNHIHLGSRGNIVVSEEKHLIATIGVDDLVIVHSPDATLICTKRDAAGIKELVDKVRDTYGDEYI